MSTLVKMIHWCQIHFLLLVLGTYSNVHVEASPVKIIVAHNECSRIKKAIYLRRSTWTVAIEVLQKEAG